MLPYDHIFHREMCSMICQTGRPLPDWPRDVTSITRVIFFREDCQDQFQYYLLLNEIELVHFFLLLLINVLFNISQKALWILPGASLKLKSVS